MNTGIITGEPSSVYHSNDAVSSSKLADIRKNGKIRPINYYKRHVAKTVPKKDASHFDFGTAFHVLNLEGRLAYESQVSVEPATYTNEKGQVKKWNGTASVCKEWKSKQDGKIIISSADAATIEEMTASIAAHQEANLLINSGDSEVTFRIEIGGIMLQVRLDKWHPNGVCGSTRATIADLKSCSDLERFERDSFFMRYFMRAEFYRLVVRAVLAKIAGVPEEEIETPDYLFVAVEKSPPHLVQVYPIDEEAADVGRKEVHADLKTVRECLATGVWPTNTNERKTLTLSSWQLAKSNDASDGALAV